MENMVNVFLYGKKYEVPGESDDHGSVGIRRISSWCAACGCRNGFCGACATVYRIKGDRELKACLACSTKVEDNMYVATLPFFPLVKEGLRY